VHNRNNKIPEAIWAASSCQEDGYWRNNRNSEAANAFFAHDDASRKILWATPFFPTIVFFMVGVNPGFGTKRKPTVLHIIPSHAITVIPKHKHTITTIEVDFDSLSIGVMGVLE